MTLLSHEEIQRKFDEIVALCKKLKEDDLLCSGLHFDVNEERKIDVSAIPLQVEPFASLFDLLETLRLSLSAHQQLRHALARYFDIDSSTWNASDVGHMLNYVESKFREELHKVEASEKGVGDKTYNIVNIAFLSEQILELYELVDSHKFKRKWRWNKMNALNRQAQAFFDRNRSKATLQSMSMSAEIILAFDELRKSREAEIAIQNFMLKIVQTDIHDGLKACFKI